MNDVNLLPATAYPTTTRSRRQGCLRAVGITTLVLLSATDVLIAVVNDKTFWPVLVLLSLGLAAILWPSASRPAWLTPRLRAAVPAGVSLALTAVARTTEPIRMFGPGEVAVLLCLLMIAVRTCPPRWAWLCAVLTGGAAIAAPLRFYATGTQDDLLILGIALVVALLAGVVAGIGGYLRSLDHRRGVAVAETRRLERLAMAADLHDFVAHHVTGILVQTQMARMMATTEPDRLDPVLAGIEHAATQALDSMRLTVGILREGPEQTAPLEPSGGRPVGDLSALAELVDGFGGPTGPKAELHRDASVPRNLPHEVQAAAYRVVQEALTNVRRHAADATEVTVALAHADDTLRVTVRDNGRAGAPMPYAARGGGFGIVGLTERVTALGGTLHTGPRKDHGWEVIALLPTMRRAGPGRAGHREGRRQLPRSTRPPAPD
ncbi:MULTISPECIES: sensor histidine kinase [Streptomyces]|uniref:sensor histidine kinase n=1 Tax=Streptomyces TaxID=1883 RepID=UPI00067FD1EB|nr:sensor histidine kinase [Streptomyces sp. LBUM 1484]MBP5874228.1 sensor histidine kinase [Streptomyces sp. LBUM 1477]MBP5881964.1 sensor histidine kinase [Streptomyces sp. LBUM 1487]MBP5897737.1 sensor histidine kinase [Streptomyces sp. LBUM 1488]MBP5925430.1 sensor histidine kinase [Streptomyces sp. LBUM 1483]MBP5941004.1 sensor histidine kinase [Streptomyces sp. LBUM 1476]MBZ3912310.1 sensor histidine kinase [Streptomyces acidiscabies]QTU44503.1 sensor histidine kinase [Streptomyces sp.